MQKISTKQHAILLILSQIIVISTVALGAYTYGRFRSENQAPVACTMDAKICPDGSAVGRSGPMCEFPACPPEPTPVTSAKLPPTAYALTPEYYIVLPTDAAHDKEWIRLGDDTYILLVNQDGGLCRYDAPPSECSYTDTPTVRLWRDRDGIFALNFMPEPIGGQSVSSVIIKKSNQASASFSADEITLWEDIMHTLVPISASSVLQK